MFKKLLSFALVSTMVLSMGTTAFAADNAIPTDIPVIPQDTTDYSTKGSVIYDYENNFIIQSFALTPQEIERGKMLQQIHTHPETSRHFSVLGHSHSLRNVVSKPNTYWSWNPSTMWTRNDKYPDSNDWPTVAWEIGTSTSAAKTLSLSVGVTDDVVSAEIGGSYTKEHSISTSTSRTYKVPYKKDGRVKVTFERPKKTFTCVTKYYNAGPPLTTYEETGAGSALGQPENIVCNIEVRGI